MYLIFLNGFGNIEKLIKYNNNNNSGSYTLNLFSSLGNTSHKIQTTKIHIPGNSSIKSLSLIRSEDNSYAVFIL